MILNQRPDNHVTRALANGRAPEYVPQVPDLTERMLTALELLYPEKCMSPGADLGEHLHYAGKVALVAALRLSFTQRQEAAAAMTPKGSPELDAYDPEDDAMSSLSGAERAT